jgi:hypothetical protein
MRVPNKFLEGIKTCQVHLSPLIIQPDVMQVTGRSYGFASLHEKPFAYQLTHFIARPLPVNHSSSLPIQSDYSFAKLFQ